MCKHCHFRCLHRYEMGVSMYLVFPVLGSFSWLLFPKENSHLLICSFDGNDDTADRASVSGMTTFTASPPGPESYLTRPLV